MSAFGQSGHHSTLNQCLLLGVRRTSARLSEISATYLVPRGLFFSICARVVRGLVDLVTVRQQQPKPRKLQKLLLQLWIVLSLSLLHTVRRLLAAFANFLGVNVQHR
jgi:hypothetical protein